MWIHTHTHTFAVPRDSEEPPGLSHASCFHSVAQKQRREGDKQPKEKERKKGRRARKTTRQRNTDIYTESETPLPHVSRHSCLPLEREFLYISIWYVCSYPHLSLCLCVSARVVLRIVARQRQPLCSSEHMVSDTSLSSAILSVYTASWQPRQKSFLLRLKGRLKENMEEH